jgi:hypothetical protein
MGDEDLRLECPDQEEASPGQREEAWARFTRG